MKDETFSELMESVRQAKAIMRGEMEPSRRFVFEKPDVKQIRADLGLTQADFAALIGISVKTLQNWEQGRRQPEGPARALLLVAARQPEAVLNALKHSRHAASSQMISS